MEEEKVKIPRMYCDYCGKEINNIYGAKLLILGYIIPERYFCATCLRKVRKYFSLSSFKRFII